MLNAVSLLLLLSFAPAPAPADQENWPGWRGPRRDGTSKETGLPLTWSATENVRWKTPLPGKGHSSPIVWGDRIFVATCVEESGKRDLVCLNRTDGKILWETTILTAELEKKHNLNSFASSTPVTDGQHVWIAFQQQKTMQVACFDFEGRLAWSKSPGQFHSVHGFCSSPLVYKDMVIFNGDQDAVAWIVALDKKTGEERWRADRPNKTRSYVPPVLIEHKGRKQLVLSGSKSVASYDPDTGKLLWNIDGPTEQFVSSLVYQDGILCLTAGFPTWHVMAIDPAGQGNVTKTHVLWHHEKVGRDDGSYVPSPIIAGKYLFVVSDTGFLSCIDLKTGEKLWKERVGKHHSASPVLVDGHLYYPDDDGITWVIKPGPKFELVSKNALGDACYASPAVSHRQLFVRTLHELWCIEKKQ